MNARFFGRRNVSIQVLRTYSSVHAIPQMQTGFSEAVYRNQLMKATTAVSRNPVIQRMRWRTHPISPYRLYRQACRLL